MQNGYFSHRDTSVNIRLNTRGWGDGTTPNPAPFYMSTAGYGAFRNTMAPGKYDFLSPLAPVARRTALRRYYFYGPSLKKILDGYTLVTGRPFFPPRWGLEFGDADCYNKTGQDARRHRRRWPTVTARTTCRAAGSCRTTATAAATRTSTATIQELHKRGFYTGLWTEKGLDRIATR